MTSWLKRRQSDLPDPLKEVEVNNIIEEAKEACHMGNNSNLGPYTAKKYQSSSKTTTEP